MLFVLILIVLVIVIIAVISSNSVSNQSRPANINNNNISHSNHTSVANKDNKNIPKYIENDVTIISTINMELLIDYNDVDDNFTKSREIIVNEIFKTENDTYYIKAFCKLRNEERRFRIDRTSNIVDKSTGEIFDKASDFIDSIIFQKQDDEISAAIKNNSKEKHIGYTYYYYAAGRMKKGFSKLNGTQQELLFKALLLATQDLTISSYSRGESFKYLAEIYKEKGDLQLALKSYEEGLALNPKMQVKRKVDKIKSLLTEK